MRCSKVKYGAARSSAMICIVYGAILLGAFQCDLFDMVRAKKSAKHCVTVRRVWPDRYSKYFAIPSCEYSAMQYDKNDAVGTVQLQCDLLRYVTARKVRYVTASTLRYSTINTAQYGR